MKIVFPEIPTLASDLVSHIGEPGVVRKTWGYPATQKYNKKEKK